MHLVLSSDSWGACSRAKNLFFALCAVLVPVHIADAAGIDYSYAQYEMPKPLPVTATKAEIAQLDADTKALVEQLRAGSPTAVDYAARAYGVLIFPRVETSNYFLLGETKALGVLYVKDEAGAYQKSSYYLGERNSLGFHVGSQTSSRVVMFMKQETLKEFLQGDVTASFMRVDPETGAVEGQPDAEVAVFITNVEGEISGVSFRGLQIVPVEFVK